MILAILAWLVVGFVAITVVAFIVKECCDDYDSSWTTCYLAAVILLIGLALLILSLNYLSAYYETPKPTPQAELQ